MNAEETISNGVWRRVFDDCVTFQPAYLRRYDANWFYAVFKYPFVPGFHVCRFDDGDEDDMLYADAEYVLSTHKTLHEAMGILKLLLANGGVKRYA